MRCMFEVDKLQIDCKYFSNDAKRCYAHCIYGYFMVTFYKVMHKYMKNRLS